MSIHPGAAIFGPEARKAIADGPAFARQNSDGQYIREGGSCLVGALIREQWPHAFTSAHIVPSLHAVVAILRDEGVITAPFGVPEFGLIEEVNDLMDRNDEGIYADRGYLRRDLLGILAARAYPAPQAEIEGVA